MSFKTGPVYRSTGRATTMSVMTVTALARDLTPSTGRPAGMRSLLPGLSLVGCGSLAAVAIAEPFAGVSRLTAAVAVGAVIGNAGLVRPIATPGVAFAARRLLRVGVVLLGLRLSLGDVVALGPRGLVVVVVTVAATFFGTQWLGRRLGLSRDLSLLVATGYSICGASAIAAVEGATDAEEEEVAAAIGLVTLFGSLAIVVLPFLATPLGLNDEGFGAWAGASVHDVAQVVAAASHAGAPIVAIAVVVKLTRVVLLAPLVAGVNVHRRREMSGTGGRPPLMPLFVALFLGAVAMRTTGWLSSETVSIARDVEGWLLTAALVGLGAGVRIDRLRRLGPRPLVLGAIAWVVVAGVSYAGVITIVQ